MPRITQLLTQQALQIHRQKTHIPIPTRIKLTTLGVWQSRRPKGQTTLDTLLLHAFEHLVLSV